MNHRSGTRVPGTGLIHILFCSVTTICIVAEAMLYHICVSPGDKRTITFALTFQPGPVHKMIPGNTLPFYQTQCLASIVDLSQWSSVWSAELCVMPLPCFLQWSAAVDIIFKSSTVAVQSYVCTFCSD